MECHRISPAKVLAGQSDKQPKQHRQIADRVSYIHRFAQCRFSTALEHGVKDEVPGEGGGSAHPEQAIQNGFHPWSPRLETWQQDDSQEKEGVLQYKEQVRKRGEGNMSWIHIQIFKRPQA